MMFGVGIPEKIRHR